MTDTGTTSGAAQRFREFKMPDVGEGLTEAEILKWYVQPGDTVTDGQVVCEVETAKAAVELPSPFDGVVHELHFAEGTTVDVGMVIISVDTQPGAAADVGAVADVAEEADAAASAVADASATASASDSATDSATASAAEPAAEARTPVLVGYGVSTASTKRRARKGAQPAPARAEPAKAALQAELNGGGAAPTAPSAAPSTAPPGAAPAEGRPLAKPPVRKLAKDLGIDLATVAASGANGVITREDVHAAAAPAPAATEPERPAATAPAISPSAPTPSAASSMTAVSTDRETRVPIKGVRKAIAQAMVTSAFTAPHVTEFVTLDVTRTMKLVQDLKQDPDMAGLRVNPLLLVAKAFLVALKRNPEANAAWDEANQEIVHKRYVNLGIAAATPRGLIVPNIKDAHTLALPELSAALGDLISTARDGKTSPAAMSGGTVTITNVGVFGVDTGTPILNPGESAILAVGAIKLQPWVHKGKVKPRQVTTLALSFDHRLVDGELGSKVLADIAAILENPKRLITWG
ncbi:dihydrolipoamide acetyltransferase family protein [Streptomyces sp. H27-D2]|uniref:dihydrolipoamide acetyltransferase family protein n=1 Tax=Streptomyces sp. H27-D2 TaxID=3046304 RepID=UPI002DBFDAEA|nr:dihydrolipoamide acetyltransferase family protein [Streptomyces sp. H27-D2]MEC4017359.1 dihydrolipoamide acetyltransferase family protein [Streptomyces sp. H27-D2]